MSAIFRSLTQSPDLSDPRGYYVGRAAVRLETRTTSVVWSDDSLVAQPNILKVPAREFLRFWLSGARVQLTRSAVSIAHGEHLRAVLPGVDESHYCDELQIREHQDRRALGQGAERERIAVSRRAHGQVAGRERVGGSRRCLSADRLRYRDCASGEAPTADRRQRSPRRERSRGRVDRPL